MSEYNSENGITSEDVEWLGRMRLDKTDENDPNEVAEDILDKESHQISLDSLISAYKKYLDESEGEAKRFVEYFRNNLKLFKQGLLHPNAENKGIPAKYINSKTFRVIEEFLNMLDRGEIK